jgi:hypothetical protein
MLINIITVIIQNPTLFLFLFSGGFHHQSYNVGLYAR